MALGKDENTHILGAVKRIIIIMLRACGLCICGGAWDMLFIWELFAHNMFRTA